MFPEARLVGLVSRAEQPGPHRAHSMRWWQQLPGKGPACHLNLTHCDDTKSSMRRDVISGESVTIKMGKLDMKLFGFSLFGQAIKAAGVGAALMLSVSAGHAQSGGPFAGFDGAWSGNGTVALSDGTTERIRCKASYKVAGTSLKQSLQCASDSYKFNLSSDVTSQGDRISGNWTAS